MAVLAIPQISHIGEPGTPEFCKLDNMLAELKLGLVDWNVFTRNIRMSKPFSLQSWPIAMG
jgi:hypothetical protein